MFEIQNYFLLDKGVYMNIPKAMVAEKLLFTFFFGGGGGRDFKFIYDFYSNMSMMIYAAK